MRKKDTIKNIIIIILLSVAIIQSNAFQSLIINARADRIYSQQEITGTIVGYNNPNVTIFKFFLLDGDTCVNLELEDDAEILMPAEAEESFRNRAFFGKVRVDCTITYNDHEAGVYPVSAVVFLE